MKYVYRSSPFRSTLDMCEICTKAVLSVALWTRVYITALDMCEVCTEAVLSVAFEHGLHYSFGHVWSMYRSSPFRSTLTTGYITALDMCEVCTKAVHSVALGTRVTLYSFGHAWSMYQTSPFPIALWTRVTLQLWTCVKYVPKQSIP